MNKYYILEGHTPVLTNIMTWVEWFSEAKRRVASKKIGDIHISTIFLSHGYGFIRGKPLLFETLVFGGPLDGKINRYTTWDKAEKGHKAMVARVEKALKVKL